MIEGKTVLLSSLQEFTESGRNWLLLRYLICLHNQLSSIHTPLPHFE